MQDQPKILPGWIAVLSGLLLIGWVAPGLGLPLCLVIAAYALKGPKESLQALTVLAFLIMISRVDISLGRWAIMFAAFGRTLLDITLGEQSTPWIIRPLLIYAAVVLVTSLFVSIFPTVSILKLVTFTIGSTTILITLYLTRHMMGYWLSWIYTLGIFILMASLPLYFLSAGYTTNGVGFQGITSHPQTFGPVLAPLTALFTGLYLFKPGHTSRWTGAATLLGWLGMFMSQSRTSMFAAVLGLVLVLTIALLFKNKEWGDTVRRIFRRREVAFAGILLLVMLGFQWTSIQAQLMGFVYKDDNASGVSEILEGSRGHLIDRSMENFQMYPLTGIGFGVPSNPDRFTRHLETGPFGIPVGASVEKGYMPTAVLEETGIVGTFFLIVLLTALLVQVIRSGNMIAFWMFSTALLWNLGEMIFFAMGGNGLYMWIILGFCYFWAQHQPEESEGEIVNASY